MVTPTAGPTLARQDDEGHVAVRDLLGGQGAGASGAVVGAAAWSAAEVRMVTGP